MRCIIRTFANFLFKKENKGAVVVEFALVLTPFLLLILFTMELSRVIYAYAAIDLSLSEASQQAAYSGNLDGNSTNYEALFNTAFHANIDKTPLLFKDDQIDVTVKYCSDINQIIANNCSASDNNRPLAVYRIVYHYKPVFFFFSSELMNPSLVRNVVHVQEYQRTVS